MIHSTVALCGSAPVLFRKGEVQAPAITALLNESIVKDLWSLGAITLEAASPGTVQGKIISPGTKLAAIIMDYAIEAAPRTPDSDATIDVPGLAARAGRMRQVFGDQPIPEQYCAAIRATALEMIKKPGLLPDRRELAAGYDRHSVPEV